MFSFKHVEVIVMVTRRKRKKVVKKISKSCVCGECEQPHPQLRGYLLMALGLMFLPISFGFFPEFDWVANGWPVLLVMFGIVLVAKATICEKK
jgi:hypothetical protein